MSKTFAYIRVSSKDQSENRQLDSLTGLNIDEVIVEKASGKNFVDNVLKVKKYFFGEKCIF